MLPYVSVVMPVRNEVDHIDRSLRAVLGQDYPSDRLEVVVVDGRSNDGTRERVAEWVSRSPEVPVRLIDNPGQIVPAGLNIALRQTRGDIIVRVDGHCEVARDYVRRCVEHLRNDGVDGVGGSIETVGETPLARDIAVAISSVFGIGDSAFRTVRAKTMLADTVPFPAYTREAIERAGAYDEELVRNQDDEYNYRLRKMGASILLAADLRSKYYSRASLGQLWRQFFQYGFWKVRVLQKHPRQMRPRQFVPPLFVLSLLISALLAGLSPSLRVVFALLVGSYLSATAVASFRLGLRHGWGGAPLLPVIFSVLHVSYGLGFLRGLVHFRRRWGDKQGKVPDLTLGCSGIGTS